MRFFDRMEDFVEAVSRVVECHGLFPDSRWPKYALKARGTRLDGESGERNRYPDPRLLQSVLTIVGTVAIDTLALVDALGVPESTAGIRRVSPDAPGGTGGNVATALAGLGESVRLVAAVGADFAGSACEAALERRGIDLSGISRVETPTARAYMFFDRQGRQMTYFYGGASHALDDKTHVEGRAHFAAGEIGVYPSLMQQAEWVSFDPGQEIFHRDLKEIEACLPHVDLLFLNEHELARLRERADLGVAALHDLGVRTVVETLGAKGCIVHTPDGEVATPAVPVDAVDPTGAGDAHRAGFLYALEHGADLQAAARFASVMGSFAVEHMGAQAGLPTREQAFVRFAQAYGASPFS